MQRYEIIPNWEKMRIFEALKHLPPMKYNLLLFIILNLLTLSPALAQNKETLPFWNDLSITSLNKERPHAWRIPCGREGESYLMAAPRWHFAFADHPDKIDSALLAHDYPLATLPTLHVPGNIELQGFGVPVYVNMRNEFIAQPPFVPTDFNPTGLYLQDVQLPVSWDGRRIFVRFGAVRSALYLYVNGKFVGYSEDSKTPAEFDISKYVSSGRNRIAAKVLRWCNGSYLECQDMWRMSGITREVLFYSTPQHYICDYWAQASLDNSNTLPQLHLDVWLGVFDKELPQGYRMQVELSRAASTTADESTERYSLGVLPVPANGHLEADLQQALQSLTLPILPWSTEYPNLYRLHLSLLPPNSDKPSEQLSVVIGFRNMEIKNGLYCLNGKPFTVRGVNRHEHSGYTGQYVSRDEMRQDVLMMKANNINAVRTSHYPTDEYFLHLCDSVGLLVWDEANCESHAQGYGEESLAKQPEWTEAIWQRSRNMILRDRNYACIGAWSLGNECGNGICFEQAYDSTKALDPTRPIVHERAILDNNTDIVAEMYVHEEHLERYAMGELSAPPTRPFILAEYCHAMGNSCGGLQDYWRVIRQYDCLQGGFIWDWADQSILVQGTPEQNNVRQLLTSEDYPYKEQDESHAWEALGSDLGALPGIQDDDDFCGNGLVNSRRQPHSALEEVRKVYQPIRITDKPWHRKHEKMHFTLHNDWLFTDLKECTIHTRMLSPTGECLAADSLRRACAPSDNIVLTLPIVPGSTVAQIIVTKQQQVVAYGESWAIMNDDIQSAPGKMPEEEALQLSLQRYDDSIVIANSQHRWVITLHDGALARWQYQGKELLAAPMQVHLWRPPTQNDLADPNGAAAWEGLDNLTFEFIYLETKQNSVGDIYIQLSARLNSYDGPPIRLSEYFIFAPQGEVLVGMQLDPNNAFATLPRVGWQMALPQPADSLTARWVGRGTPETALTQQPGQGIPIYRDRQSAGLFGRQQANGAELYERYAVPQESGTRLFTQLSIGKKQPLLSVSAIDEEELLFSISPFDDSTLTQARRQWQLKPSPYTWLNIDGDMAGLGTATCGPGVRTNAQLSGNNIHSFFMVLSTPQAGKEIRPRLAQGYSGGGLMGPTYMLFDKTMTGYKEPIRPQDISLSRAPDKPYHCPNDTLAKRKQALALADGQRAVAGNYSSPWLGWSGKDTLLIDCTLQKSSSIKRLTLGSCHAPKDWVLAPVKVEYSVSRNGKRYSEWQPMEPTLKTEEMHRGKRRVVWRSTALKKPLHGVTHLRIRVVATPTLPSWHSQKGEKAWLMLDELELRTE